MSSFDVDDFDLEKGNKRFYIFLVKEEWVRARSSKLISYRLYLINRHCNLSEVSVQTYLNFLALFLPFLQFGEFSYGNNPHRTIARKVLHIISGISSRM
jgi:hypothetical protein